MPRLHHTALSVLSCALVATTSLAAPAHAAADERDDWALGASLRLQPLLLGGLMGLGGLGSLSEGPTPGVVLERRLSDAWWLTFGVSGHYREADNGALDRSLGGELGVRWVLDPSARVRVAPTARLVASTGLSRASINGEGLSASTDVSRTHFGLGVGLDLDLVVTRGFLLRLSTTLLQVGTSAIEVASTDPDIAASEVSEVALDVVLAPAMVAVWTF